MSKLMGSVLEKVSENNNEYRSKLRELNSSIDNFTTSFVGDLVSASNYVIDFSSAVSEAKDNLINQISRIIESFAIKDLRSVETVNEQFVEKINDKIETSHITSREEKQNFIDNLDDLLNKKYLEIVKIKRTPFVNDLNVNEEIEDVIKSYVDGLVMDKQVDETAISMIVNEYKDSLYKMIDKTLMLISDIYLNNFVSEVKSALASSLDFENDFMEENQVSTPVAPSPVPEPVFTPFVPEDLPQEPIMPMPRVDTNLEEVHVPEVKDEPDNSFQIEEKPVYPKPMDVEEILKIAKSPIVTMNQPSEPKEVVSSSNGYEKIDVIVPDKKERLDDDFNEREMVEEMIRRLTARLELIDQRQKAYDAQEEKISEDENFVNDLIVSADKKHDELNDFEKGLNDKEKELERKQKELNEKLNSVLPFANAVLENDK